MSGLLREKEKGKKREKKREAFVSAFDRNTQVRCEGDCLFLICLANTFCARQNLMNTPKRLQLAILCHIVSSRAQFNNSPG